MFTAIITMVLLHAVVVIVVVYSGKKTFGRRDY